MRIAAETSDKIKVIGFFLTLIVVFHHGFNLQFATSPTVPVVRFSENIFHFALRGLAVPFFFVLSAYFLFARSDFIRSYRSEVRKRVHSLLIPFLVWSFAWLVIMYALQSIPGMAPYFGREIISLADPLQLVRLMTLDPIPHPLWYMRDLFLLTLISPLILGILSSRIGAIIYFGMSLVLWCSFPSLQVREAQDLIFFGLGAWLALHPKPMPTVSLATKSALGIGSLVFFLWHCWWVETYQAEQPLIFNAGILLGLPALWFGFDELRRWLLTPRLLALSKYALFIYVGHEPLQALIRKSILHEAGGSSMALVLVWLGTSTFVIGTLIGTSIALSRFVPWFYRVLVGGRSLDQQAIPRPIPSMPPAIATA